MGGVTALCGDLLEFVLGEVGEVCGVRGGHFGGCVGECWVQLSWWSTLWKVEVEKKFGGS